MDRSNNDRGFCSFLDASTVHSRANAATSAVSAASFCFFFEDRREKGRMLAVRASCILFTAVLSQDGGMTSYSVQLSLPRARIHSDAALLALGLWLAVAASAAGRVKLVVSEV